MLRSSKMSHSRVGTSDTADAEVAMLVAARSTKFPVDDSIENAILSSSWSTRLSAAAVLVCSHFSYCRVDPRKISTPQVIGVQVSKGA